MPSPTPDPTSHTRRALTDGKRLSILVTAEEHAAIVAHAHAAGTSVSNYVRRCALLGGMP